MSHDCHRFWKCHKTFTFCSLVARCRIPCACHAKPHLNLQKWSKHVVFLNILTWKCASRHNGVHFFDMSTSRCFVQFDLEMWLRATMVRTFSTSQLAKVVRDRQFLTLLTWTCASLHNGVHFFDISTCKKCFETASFFTLLTWKCHSGVQFFISHLPRWLRTRRFSEPTFRPSGATNHWKNTSLCDFSTFSRTCIFFLPRLSLLLIFFLLLFSSLTLPTSAFSSVHIVGSLTSKLPSIKRYSKTERKESQPRTRERRAGLTNLQARPAVFSPAYMPIPSGTV